MPNWKTIQIEIFDTVIECGVTFHACDNAHEVDFDRSSFTSKQIEDVKSRAIWAYEKDLAESFECEQEARAEYARENRGK